MGAVYSMARSGIACLGEKATNDEIAILAGSGQIAA
jgi:hypothetical protein